MISGINSMSSMMSSSSMVRQPPPDKDVFKMADADSDGLVTGSELETLVEGMEEITGTSIDIDEAFSTFDADQDGALSGEELLGLLAGNGFSTPGMFDNENGEAERMPPPPPPSSEQVMSAYTQNTGDDEIEQLMQFLEEQNGDDWEFSSIDVTG